MRAGEIAPLCLDGAVGRSHSALSQSGGEGLGRGVAYVEVRDLGVGVLAGGVQRDVSAVGQAVDDRYPDGCRGTVAHHAAAQV